MPSPSNKENQQQESPSLLEQLQEEIKDYVFQQDLAVIEDQICDCLCGVRQLPTEIKSIVNQEIYKEIPNLAQNVTDFLITINEDLLAKRIISSSSFYQSLRFDTDVVISPSPKRHDVQEDGSYLLHSPCSIALPNSPDSTDNELRPFV